MTAFLLTWKESGWPYANISRMLNTFAAEGSVEEPWRLISSRLARVGNRAWLLRQGPGSKGIFGLGEITGPAKRQLVDGNSQMMAPVRFTALSDPRRSFLISETDVRNILSEGQIRTQASGISLTDDQSDALLAALGRLPTEILNRVTADYIWRAVNRLLTERIPHSFGDSTDFDVLCDEGERLPPKAVFGVAATEALGFEVLPRHFSAGEGTPCFRIIRSSGFEIVPKEMHGKEDEYSQPPADREWLEGHAKLVGHLRRERAPGLTEAKKAEFIRQHGRLFCERCNLEPARSYPPTVADACIEVHHRQIQVRDMQPGHRTQLVDLQCLCANCHRVVHRELRLADARRCR